MTDLLLSAVMGFFDSFVIAAVLIISFQRYNRTKYIQFLFLTLEFFGLFSWIFLTSISNLMVYVEVVIGGELVPSLLATLFGYAGYFTLLYMTIFLIFFVDSISRTNVDPVKLLVFGVLATLATVAALIPGQAAKDITLLTYYISALFWCYRSFLWTYYAAKVFINSPPYLKRKSLTVLTGTIFTGVIPSFFIITMIVIPDLGINEILLAIGIVLIAVPLILEPKLLYVLPFRTSRLTVFNKSGAPLFSHYWSYRTEETAGDSLFSGVMTGISGILKESLHKGHIREISLDKSVLLIERIMEYPVTFVLETSKTSKSLPKALKTFAEGFIKQYSENLLEGVDSQKSYTKASNLVSQCFPFLPEYKE